MASCNRPHHAFLCIAVAVALTACNKESAPSASVPSASTTNPQTTWLVSAMPEGAVDVAELKRTAKEGDAVVIRGRIGGTTKPIAPDIAVFTIVDPAVPSCADAADDHCATPWDYCCETPESMARSTATIQILDPTGAPVSGSVEAAGFAPLDTVIIVGTVGPRPDPRVLTIRATGVHRVGG